MVWTAQYAENRKKKRRANAKKHGWPEKSKKEKEKNRSRKRASRRKKCPKGYEVDHKDGNARNNSPSNLRCLPVKKNRGWSKGKKLGKRK